MARAMHFSGLSVRPYLAGATFVLNLLGLAVPLILLVVYESVMPSEDPTALAPVALAAIIVFAMEFVIRVARAQLTAHAQAHIEAEATRWLYRSLLTRAGNEPKAESAHHQLAKFQKVSELGEATCGDSAMAPLEIPFAVAYLVVIFLIAPPAFAGLIFLICLALLGTQSISDGNADLSDNFEDIDARRQSFIHEVLAQVETVKALSVQAFMERRYERLMSGGAASRGAMAANTAMVRNIMSTAATWTPFLVAAIGASLVIDGEMSIGALAATIMLSGRAMQQMLKFSPLERVRRKGLKNWQAIAEGQPRTSSALGRIALDAVEHVQAEGLSVAGNDGAEQLIEDVNFTLRRGEAIAIKGPSGSGKSRLLAAIAGHLPPSRGHVLINGHSPSAFDPNDLRRNIAFATQQPQLLSGTILENMTRFRPGLLRAEALELAEHLGLDEFLSRHQLGYSMQVGRGAANGLPAAVVTRIALIAALVGQPSLILFDEANLSLDAASDRLLRAHLEKIRGDTAMILVTHRPSYHAICRQVFEISGGRLVADRANDRMHAEQVTVPRRRPFLLTDAMRVDQCSRGKPDGG